MNLSHLGENIKKSRKKLNLTQAEVCELVDLSITYYSNIERGAKTPRLETFVKIAQALDVTPSELLADNHKFKESEKKDVHLSIGYNTLTEAEHAFIQENINTMVKQLKVLRDI